MLLSREKSAACICPFCSTPIKTSVSAFDFSGNSSVLLKCPNDTCGEICAEIIPKGKKYKIEVECLYCANTHTFSVISNDLWNKKINILKCSESGLDILFFGDEPLVADKINETIKTYNELISQNVVEENSEGIMYDMLSRLGLLEHSHNIECICGSDKIFADIIPEGIVLQCSSCKKTIVYPICEESLIKLLNTDKILIK